MKNNRPRPLTVDEIGGIVIKPYQIKLVTCRFCEKPGHTLFRDKEGYFHKSCKEAEK